MEFSYGGQPPIPTSKSSSAFNPRLPINSELTSVNNHRIHEDLQLNTVLSEIKSGIPITEEN
jgi:hypothetical protein